MKNKRIAVNRLGLIPVSSSREQRTEKQECKMLGWCESSSNTSDGLAGSVRDIHARTLHSLRDSVDPPQSYIKSWRKALQLVHRGHDTMVHESLATSAIDTTGITAGLEFELGKTFTEIQEFHQRALSLYVQAIGTRADADARLAAALTRLEEVHVSIQSLQTLESTPELALLTEPTRIYLDSVVKQLNVAEAHQTSAEQAMRLSLLRSVLGSHSHMGVGVGDGPTCMICMGSAINHVLIPCGHTFCEDCCDKQKTACYTCRAQIRDRLRIYVG